MKKKIFLLFIFLLSLFFYSCDDYMKRVYKDVTRIIEKYDEKNPVDKLE